MITFFPRMGRPVLRQVPRAVVVATVVELGLRVMRLPRLASLLDVPLAMRSVGPRETVPDQYADLVGLADDLPQVRAARAVLRRWPFGRDRQCLRKSLVVGYLLRHRHPELRIGVRSVDGAVQAHAWLVLDGMDLDLAAMDYAVLRPVRSGP